MKVLVACEFSGRVREAFRKRGHNAWSCDLLDAEDGSEYHFQENVFDVLENNKQWGPREWDLMIAHPPCTYLARSGARWWKDRQDEQRLAIEFVKRLQSYPIPRLAIENPIGKLSGVIGKPSQIIQPWQFGHGETKATCLWLRGLPLLQPTEIVEGRDNRIHLMPESRDRWKHRSRTYPGIARAMAEQWG